MNDECIEAQALYSLGATAQLMNNPREAISYYLGNFFLIHFSDVLGALF